MSTPNFALKNASRYFAFGEARYITQEDIDANGWDQDELGKYDEIGTEIDYEDAIYSAKSELESKGWDDIDETDGDRSYPSHFFATKCIDLHAGDTEIYVTVRACYTSGYYSGANFDWDVNIRVCGYIDGWYQDNEYEEVSKSDVINDNWYDNNGLSAIHAQRMVAKVDDAIERLTHEAEMAFSRACSMELGCTAVFSNGEAMYDKLNNRLCDTDKAA